MLRLMSNYDVSLVNDNMQEFNIKFHGPSDSKTLIINNSRHLNSSIYSTISRWDLEGSCRNSR